MGRLPQELEQGLTSGELTELMALYEMEPFGPWRDNYHAAFLAALIANVNRVKGQSPVKADEFMLKDHQARRDDQTRHVISVLKHRARQNP